MTNNVYIGNRYVPIFADPVEWDSLRSYEALTIVTYLGTSYTSRKSVPAGTLLSNGEYWVVTGNYNAQVAQLMSEVGELKECNFVNVSSFTGANDTEILQNAIDNSEFIYVDRDMTVTSVDVDTPTVINLGGHTITASTSSNNAFNVLSSNIEIYNGRIVVTESTPDNANNYGSCVYLMNKTQFVNPPIMKNVNIHDLYLSTNGALGVCYMGEITDSVIYNVEFDGTRCASTNAQVAINLEWAGVHGTQTYHPHRIKVFNMYAHNYTQDTAMPLRISGCFDMTFENVTIENSTYGFTLYAGDYAGDDAPLRYKAFVNSNFNIKNCNMNNVKVPVKFNGDSTHTSGYIREVNVENVNTIGVDSATNVYQGFRGAYTKNVSIRNCQLRKYYTGVNLSNSNDGALLDNCLIEDVTTYGAMIVGDNIKFTNNVVRRTNKAESTTLGNDVACLVGNGNGVFASNNTLAMDANETAMRAFRTPSTANNVIFIGNVYGKNLNINETITSVIDNNIYVTA